MRDRCLATLAFVLVCGCGPGIGHPLARGEAEAPPAGVTSTIPTDEEIRAVLRKRVDGGATHGLVVGVLDHGQTRIIAYGRATDGRDTATVDGDTPFEIGSITKVFTAVLCADMVAILRAGATGPRAMPSRRPKDVGENP